MASPGIAPTRTENIGISLRACFCSLKCGLQGARPTNRSELTHELRDVRASASRDVVACASGISINVDQGTCAIVTDAAVYALVAHQRCSKAEHR